MSQVTTNSHVPSGVATDSQGYMWTAAQAWNQSPVTVALLRSTDQGATWTQMFTFSSPRDADHGFFVWIDRRTDRLFLVNIVDGLVNGIRHWTRSGSSYSGSGTLVSPPTSLSALGPANPKGIIAFPQSNGNVMFVQGKAPASRYAYLGTFVVNSSGAAVSSNYATMYDFGADGYGVGITALEFKHTGDGYTPVSDTPPVWFIREHGGSGAMVFCRATWGGSNYAVSNTNNFSTSGYAYMPETSDLKWDGTTLLLLLTDYLSFNATSTNPLKFWVKFFNETLTEQGTGYQVTSPSDAYVEEGKPGFGIDFNGANSNIYLYIFHESAYQDASVRYAKFTRTGASSGSWGNFARITANGLIQTTAPFSMRTTRDKYAGVIGLIYSTQSTGVNWYTAATLNTAPTVTLNAPGTFDPRLPKTFTWGYSDPDGNGQYRYEFGYKPQSSGTWTTVIVTSADKFRTFAANTFTDETNYDWRLRADDNVAGWGNYATGTFRTDSWTYGPEVAGVTESGTLATTGFDVGEYEVGVRTSDAEGFGPWSSGSITFETIITNVSVFRGGAFVEAERFIYVGGQWVQSNPERINV